ncbi:MAG: DUF5069 domain-containing protein [Verrucomicrobiota bacterium]
MSNYDWTAQFREIYQRAVETYRKGNRQPGSFFIGEDVRFLASIGCTPQELFDFVEDWCRFEEPHYDDVLLVTATRREYFLTVQKGRLSDTVIDMDRLPAKDDKLDGIAWLPRIIEKARAKLRGEMPPDLMYGCGGDRPFLRGANIHLADFLRVVWAAGEDRDQIVRYVKQQSGQR